MTYSNEKINYGRINSERLFAKSDDFDHPLQPKAVSYGIIGTGWIAEAFLTAAKKVDGLNLSCVYSRTEEKALEFSKKAEEILGVEPLSIFTDLEKMAASEKLDAVYIASPNLLHVPQSELFLKNKKHVICEKPLALNGNEVKRLLNLAKQNNVIYMEAIMGLHSPQFAVLQAGLGKIGRITQAEFEFCQLSSKYPALLKGELPNIFNPKMQTGSIMDIGIYCVYPALALFGVPSSITSKAVLHENGIDICGNSIFSYPDKLVTLSYSKVGDGRTASKIIGDKGTITVQKLSHIDGIELIGTDGKAEMLHKNSEDILPMQHEAKSFYDYILDMKKGFKLYSDKYDRLSELAISVSDTMHEMRRQIGSKF